MIIGFTGTREPLPEAQRDALAAFFASMVRGEPQRVELHHGDCVGADAFAHGIAAGLGWYIVGHPCDIKSMRAHCAFDHEHPPMSPLDRNRLIVGACSILVACPKGPEETRSGTWATVRYARRLKREIVIVWPDGSTTEETGHDRG